MNYIYIRFKTVSYCSLSSPSSMYSSGHNRCIGRMYSLFFDLSWRWKLEKLFGSISKLTFVTVPRYICVARISPLSETVVGLEGVEGQTDSLSLRNSGPSNQNVLSASSVADRPLVPNLLGFVFRGHVSKLVVLWISATWLATNGLNCLLWFLTLTKRFQSQSKRQLGQKDSFGLKEWTE